MLSRIGGLLLAGAAPAVAPAQVQDGAVHIEQQPSAVVAGRTGASQISAPSGDRSGDAPDTASAPTQIGAPDRDTLPPAQLTDERRGTAAGPQLSQGGTAESPEPLSRPSEGRTGAVARVEGEDRCAAAVDADRPAICDRVIESRAADFASARAPVLSPEQRLLVDQRLREAGLVTRAANRGASLGEIDPDRLDGQTVATASAALNRAERERANDPTEATSALPEVPSALLEAVLGTPLPPSVQPR